MLTRAEKDVIVNGIRDNIEKSRAMFVTNLIGVPSNEANAVRKKVRESQGTVVITRNTLFSRAAEGTKAESILKGLKGPNAVAFAFEDAPGVAKALYDAGKELELIQLKSGLLGEQVLSVEEVIVLAKLPSRDQMLGTLLATFNAPISAFARVLNAIRENKEEGVETVAEAPVEAPKDDSATEEKPE